jgi:hypothetical protein
MTRKLPRESGGDIDARARKVRVAPPPPRYIGYEAMFAEWAESQGWDVTKRGWPDFMCRRNGALMVVEVKGGSDDITPEQIASLDFLSDAGIPTYVYHYGLGLKRWRHRKRESVDTLKAEIGELYALMARIVQVRDEMQPGVHRKPSPDWTIQDELEVVIRWCEGRHNNHGLTATRMTHCSWIYFLRKQENLDWQEIVKIAGGFSVQIQGLYKKASRAVQIARDAQEEYAAA